MGDGRFPKIHQNNPPATVTKNKGSSNHKGVSLFTIGLFCAGAATKGRWANTEVVVLGEGVAAGVVWALGKAVKAVGCNTLAAIAAASATLACSIACCPGGAKV